MQNVRFLLDRAKQCIYIAITSHSVIETLNIIGGSQMADGTKKKNKKDSQLVIRIKREERDRFISLCDDLDTSAAREIRRFIKSFITEHPTRD